MSRDIEKYAEDYLVDDFEFVMSKYRKALVKKILEKYNAKRIVDIGPAYNYLYMDYTAYTDYTVIEPSKIMTDKMVVPNANVHIINDFLENVYKNISEKPDFIIASGLIHEIENTDKFMQCVKELCKKDTIFHISAPNFNSFHMVYAKEAGLINKLGELSDYSKKMQRIRTYDINILSSFVESYGFEILDKGPFYFKFFNNSKMADCIKYNIFDENLLKTLNNIAEIYPDNAAEVYINCRLK